MSETYTYTQIKNAFRNQFHDARELWFGGDERDWEPEWNEFYIKLKKEVEGS